MQQAWMRRCLALSLILGTAMGVGSQAWSRIRLDGRSLVPTMTGVVRTNTDARQLWTEGISCQVRAMNSDLIEEHIGTVGTNRGSHQAEHECKAFALMVVAQMTIAANRNIVINDGDGERRDWLTRETIRELQARLLRLNPEELAELGVAPGEFLRMLESAYVLPQREWAVRHQNLRTGEVKICRIVPVRGAQARARDMEHLRVPNPEYESQTLPLLDWSSGQSRIDESNLRLYEQHYRFVCPQT